MTRKKKIILAVSIIFLVASFLRYRALNKSNRYGIYTYDVTLNTPQDMEKLTYTFTSIKREKIYEKTYQSNIFRYHIAFKAENNTDLKRDLNIWSSMVVVSGGTPWWIDPLESRYALDNAGVKLVLQPNETTSGEVQIDVIPEKKGEGYYTADVLKDFDVYYVEKFSNGGYKYHIAAD